MNSSVISRILKATAKSVLSKLLLALTFASLLAFTQSSQAVVANTVTPDSQPVVSNKFTDKTPDKTENYIGIATADTTYTLAQVASNNTRTSCWTIYQDQVYNITSYISRHPGGVSAISKLCGVDGTAIFNNMHGASSSQATILATYRIGALYKPPALSCNAGYFVSVDQGGCSPAPVGYFVTAQAAAAGTTVAIPCPLGKFSSLAGSTECAPASPGYFVDTQAATQAKPCPQGYFSSVSGSVFCQAASKGFYVPATASTSATACEAGFTTTTTGSTSSSSCYKISDAPTLTDVSATSGKKGQALDILGTNLDDALGNTVILYTPATTKLAAISTPVTVLSVNTAGTRITVLSPAVTQKGNFRVTNSYGTATSAALFSASSSATSKPTITMTASLVQEVGSTFSLSGTNLASATTITIGSVNATFSIVNATTIVITVPAGVVSGSKISATNIGGTTTTSKFVFQAAVVATTTQAAKVGQTVTVTGTNLLATAVVFGGMKSAKPVINNGSTLTVVVPTGALTGPIKITTGAGVVYTSTFTVTPPTPTVTSFTPMTGKNGVTVVTVKGTNLTGATVTIGSTPVTVSPGASATSLKFVIPAGASSGKITVTTPGGSAISVSTLTIN